MQVIYNFDGSRIYTGLTDMIEDDQGIKDYWTSVAPPEVISPQVASFQGPEWVILEAYPIQPAEPPAPIVTRTINPAPATPLVL